MSEENIRMYGDVMDEVMASIEAKMNKAAAWETYPGRWEFPERPTWEDVVAREPRLEYLQTVALNAGLSCDSYAAWYERVKPEIERLVGRGADDQPPPFWSSRVYDAVYQHLLRIYETGERP